jgi:hypothetical protein
MPESLFSRLLVWTLLGLFYAVATFVCALRNDWIGFIASLVTTNVVIVALYSGLWGRWPRA